MSWWLRLLPLTMLCVIRLSCIRVLQSITLVYHKGILGTFSTPFHETCWLFIICFDLDVDCNYLLCSMLWYLKFPASCFGVVGVSVHPLRLGTLCHGVHPLLLGLVFLSPPMSCIRHPGWWFVIPSLSGLTIPSCTHDCCPRLSCSVFVCCG